MIHPKTELRYINDIVGYGVFALEDIPEGTIVYVKDSLEIVVSSTDYMLHSEAMKTIIEKYSYIDEHGNRIVSWDFAKYVNHCCNCNTISTGYGFEFAVRDIQAGEQITDEYGIFNIEQEMNLICGESCCRKKLSPDDFENYHELWDSKIKKSLTKLPLVKQPLMYLLDNKTREELKAYFRNPEKYISVYRLKFVRDMVNHL
ncbi:MAG: SET domain-containing protein [Microscillaceae bacterium]|nr:SET domain-containing protein [Microscillaceae bacterium]